MADHVKLNAHPSTEETLEKGWHPPERETSKQRTEFLGLTTIIIVFIVEAHSQSEKVEVWTKIKYSSITGERLLSNQAVVYKQGKSRHQNCIKSLTTPWANS